MYTCLTGYESTGGSLTRKCQANKTLTGDNPSCSSKWHLFSCGENVQILWNTLITESTEHQ